MDNFGLRESRDIKFDRYFKKTGILVTDEPTEIMPPEIDQFIQDHYPYLQKRPRKYVQKLERLHEKYPNIPSIQNYLYLVYSLTDQESKATAILKKTIKDHPDYIFGFCSKILDSKSWKEAEEYAHAMGKDMDIRSLKKKDEVIHISEFRTYQITAGFLHCIKGEEKKAGERLESLMELGDSRKEIEAAAKKISSGNIFRMSRRIEKSRDMQRQPEFFDKVGMAQTEEPPMLNHEELRVFYEKETKELTEEERKKLIALPRATLIQDLETILEDGIRRFDFFKKEFSDGDYQNFMVHALWFLAALNSKDSLPKVLNLFRMGDEFRNFWFGDWFENYFNPALEIFASDQLELLADFFKEENIGTWTKTAPLNVFRQVGLKYPDRREEVLDFFEKTANYFFENEGNENLIDTSFMTNIAYEILILRGKKLIPILKKIDEKNWLDDMHAGNLEKILQEIELPIDSYRIEPSPENIHEFYTEAYRARKAKPPMSEGNFEDLFAEREKNMGLGEKLIERFRQGSIFSLIGGRKVETDDLLENYVGTDDFANDAERFMNVQESLGSADNFFDYERPTTVKRIGKKVGRNDPCPCGSGKKYKKCCL